MKKLIAVAGAVVLILAACSTDEKTAACQRLYGLFEEATQHENWEEVRKEIDQAQIDQALSALDLGRSKAVENCKLQTLASIEYHTNRLEITLEILDDFEALKRREFIQKERMCDAIFDDIVASINHPSYPGDLPNVEAAVQRGRVNHSVECTQFSFERIRHRQKVVDDYLAELERVSRGSR